MTMKLLSDWVIVGLENDCWYREDIESGFWVGFIMPNSKFSKSNDKHYGEIWLEEEEVAKFDCSSNNLSKIKSIMDDKLLELGFRLLDKEPELNLLV